MEVKHDVSRQEFYVELEGHRAHVAYFMSGIIMEHIRWRF